MSRAAGPGIPPRWFAPIVLALAATMASCSPTPVAPAANAPRVTVLSLDELPGPLPLPYDESALPAAVNAELDQAFERASKSGKRVIIDLGGNWCASCRRLAAVMDLPEVKPFLRANFEIVSVAVSANAEDASLNAAVLDRFKLDEVAAFPWLIIAEADGSVVSSSYEVTDGANETPQAMVNWLAQWATRPAGPHVAGGGAG